MSTAGHALRARYADPAVVESYERDRFGGAVGRWRWRREQDGVGRALDLLPPDATVLDCPVGTGRWVVPLRSRGHRVIGVDTSPAMLTAAGARHPGLPLLRADAGRLPLADGAVDAVFAHALTKHLPPAEQDALLAECARVARHTVICSFSVLSGLSGALWRLRRPAGAYGRRQDELEVLAVRCGLRIAAVHPCSTRLGVEHTLVLHRP